MVEPQPSKLVVRVRFPSPAPSVSADQGGSEAISRLPRPCHLVTIWSRSSTFLDEQCGSKSNEVVTHDMARSCEGALWRNRSGYGTCDIQLTAIQRSLYLFLREKVADATVPFEEVFPMPPRWRTSVVAEEEAVTERRR